MLTAPLVQEVAPPAIEMTLNPGTTIGAEAKANTGAAGGAGGYYQLNGTGPLSDYLCINVGNLDLSDTGGSWSGAAKTAGAKNRASIAKKVRIRIPTLVAYRARGVYFSSARSARLCCTAARPRRPSSS